MQREFFGPISGLNLGRWISGSEFLEGDFLGALSAGKKAGSKNSTQEFGSKIRRSKFVSQNSAPNSGSGRAKSPVKKFVPDFLGFSGGGGGTEKAPGRIQENIPRIVTCCKQSSPRENCPKVSKVVFDQFWPFMPCMKSVKKCQMFCLNIAIARLKTKNRLFRHFNWLLGPFFEGSKVAFFGL